MLQEARTLQQEAVSKLETIFKNGSQKTVVFKAPNR